MTHQGGRPRSCAAPSPRTWSWCGGGWSGSAARSQQSPRSQPWSSPSWSSGWSSRTWRGPGGWPGAWTGATVDIISMYHVSNVTLSLSILAGPVRREWTPPICQKYLMWNNSRKIFHCVYPRPGAGDCLSETKHGAAAVPQSTSAGDRSKLRSAAAMQVQESLKLPARDPRCVFAVFIWGKVGHFCFAQTFLHVNSQI